jgi:hypothetical protein
MTELKGGLASYIKFYNSERFCEALDYETPNTIYENRFSVRELKHVA